MKNSEIIERWNFLNVLSTEESTKNTPIVLNTISGISGTMLHWYFDINFENLQKASKKVYDAIDKIKPDILKDKDADKESTEFKTAFNDFMKSKELIELLEIENDIVIKTIPFDKLPDNLTGFEWSCIKWMVEKNS